MLPFNTSFKRLIFGKIRNLKPEDVVKFERLTALRHQLSEEKRLSRNLPENEMKMRQQEQSIDEVLNTLDLEINKLLAGYKIKLTQLHRIYMARRKAAFMQHSLFQLPSSEFFKYIGALWNYKKEQVKR
ncbi:MAG: hypothetical protein P8X42_14665 [Calditrichaceae bacterium]|jgi:hypothetical protein